jgi:proteasome accessory factor A
MGVESEYAFNLYDADAVALDRDRGLRELFVIARRRLVAVADESSSGLYLQNGARFYVDAGSHPEYSTPECASPTDVVRHVLAGERILGELAAEVSASRAGTRASIFRCNVDYVTGQTWGCHESYLHTSAPLTLSKQLIPHLVSRVIYTGSGGFNGKGDHTSFVLSPRVAHLARVSSPHSTEERGIFHTKNEALCSGGYRRLHVLCSESLCSHVASFVKIGATALVVRLIEAEKSPGEAVQLEDPLRAMRGFAADIDVTHSEQTLAGARLTAIEVQRRYLEAAETNVGADFMPSWAGEVCRQWRRLLDLLGQGPEAVADTLDWGIKLSLYAARARANGADIFALDENPAVRSELYEIDTRFGELSADSIFAELDRAELLAHRVAGVEAIEEAVTTPPDQGRARARGAAIQSAHADSSRYCANWTRLVDTRAGRVLDLSDPFGRKADWGEHRDADLEQRVLRARLLRRRRTRSEREEEPRIEPPDPAQGDLPF